MIDPFDPSKLTKPATYAVPLMGPCRYLDEDGRQHSFSLSNEKRRGGKRSETRDKFVLKPNSICYVTLEPYFRLPSYIAGRFNLLINNVYRGLLVGTGPLVDPGFNGYLSIPIHNFTTNSYQFRAGEDFVYFEFTKISWSNQTDARSSFHWCPNILHDQPPFPASKGKRRSVDDYLDNATGRGAAQSAIGKEIRRVTQTSNATRRRLEIFSVAAVAGIAVLVFAS
jgi:deoxycytidine triphosphate deaminase